MTLSANGRGSGIDSVYASVSHTLSSNVENLTLTGSANINGTGNWAANVITGNAGNNLLDGGTDADRLTGGAGNDTYYIDNTADVVIENAGEGTDGIYSSVSLTLVANVENLTLTGSWSLNATGNALANILTGNAGANILNGLGGADTMAGGTGNDTYYVDDAGDVVNDWSNAGTDTVYSTVSYTLLTHVENLALSGNGNINATGNWLSNNLTGNAGDNVLDGGTATDTMSGDSGNDTYCVDNTGDVVTEWWNRGVDTVFASVSYALTANVENLTLTNVWSLNATGNDLANILTGNQGSNLLDGAAGADTLIAGAGADILVGGAGADRLTGGAGADMFRFLTQADSTVTAHDVITDFTRGDRIDLSSVYNGTLTYRHDGAFTGHAGELRLTGSGDGVLVDIDLTGDKASDMQIYLSDVSIGAMQQSGADFVL